MEASEGFDKAHYHLTRITTDFWAGFIFVTFNPDPKPLLQSLGTLPAFLAVVGSGIAAGGVVLGAVRFLGYGLGMASVLVALTVALAFFKEGLLKWLRGALPYVQTASAILLILAGAYVIFYWWTAQSVG